MHEKRGARNKADAPLLTVDEILTWVDLYYERTGEWPNQRSGPVADAPGEKWVGIDHALASGARGLPGGSTLANLLQENRGVRNEGNLPSLSEAQILNWAVAHHESSGDWPSQRSGPVLDASGETWRNIDASLKNGGRGLPGGSSIAKLLGQMRGVRNKPGPRIKGSPTPLAKDSILTWIEAHFQRTGCWPNSSSGPILDVPGENWRKVDNACCWVFVGFQGAHR